MADELNIQLFADDSDAFEMPSIAIELNNEALTDEEIEQKLLGDTSHLMTDTEDLNKAILGDTVKSLMIPEDLEIYLPNYVIDFTGTTSLRMHQAQALDALVVPTGNVAIYVYVEGGLAKLGMARSDDIDSILPLAIKSIFGDRTGEHCACKLYKNFEKGKALNEVKEADISNIRLKL